MPDFVISILLVSVLLQSNMQTEFQYAVQLTLELEGGYVSNPDDPGGRTKYGISQRAYPNLDIMNLTRAEAISIYRRDYWDPVAEVVPDARMRIMVYDTAVNSGLSRALSWYESYPDFNDYLTHRIRFYTSLSTWSSFGRGWMRRVARVVEVANRVQAERQVVDMLIDNRSFFTRIVSAFRGWSGPTAFRVRPLASETTGMKLDIDNA